MRTTFLLFALPAMALAQVSRPGDPFAVPANEYFSQRGSNVIVTISMPTNVVHRGERMVLDVRCETVRNEITTVYLPTSVDFQGGRPKPFKVLVLDPDSTELGALVLPCPWLMNHFTDNIRGTWITIPRDCYVGKRIELTFTGNVTGLKTPLLAGEYLIQIVFSRTLVVPEPSHRMLADREWVRWFGRLQETELFRSQAMKIRLEERPTEPEH